MIPIRDTIPSKNTPVGTWILIMANSVVFVFELMIPEPVLEAFFYYFGIVPARYSHPEWASWVGLPLDDYWPFVTSMFLHGGWLHIIGNVLGPVDPQLGKYPAASILKAVARKPVAEVEDETLILADQAEKAIIQVRESVKELLQGKPTNGKVDDLARLLSGGTWTHDFPITYERAKALGLAVSSNMPDDVLKLMSLFPQPTRAQPSVEYLPIPRSRRPAPSASPRNE